MGNGRSASASAVSVRMSVRACGNEPTQPIDRPIGDNKKERERFIPYMSFLVFDSFPVLSIPFDSFPFPFLPVLHFGMRFLPSHMFLSFIRSSRSFLPYWACTASQGTQLFAPENNNNNNNNRQTHEGRTHTHNVGGKGWRESGVRVEKADGSDNRQTNRLNK